MTVERDFHDVAAEDSAARREWIRPAVQQLAAGSAEDGSGPTPDAIINPS